MISEELYRQLTKRKNYTSMYTQTGYDGLNAMQHIEKLRVIADKNEIIYAWNLFRKRKGDSV